MVKVQRALRYFPPATHNAAQAMHQQNNSQGITFHHPIMLNLSIYQRNI
jgi:protoheme ferro-lyase